MTVNRKRFHNKILYIYFLLYLAGHLFYLTKFPFMHSDESWLSGLSRNMDALGDFSVTESFFDLKVRHPHAIKIIFHGLQIFFIRFFGYDLFTVRFISLIFAMLTLYYFYKLCYVIFKSKELSITAVLLLSLDIQFIYASHFARQEIILLFVLVFGLYFTFTHMDNHKFKHDFILGILIGLSIGIHPNSFILSIPFGCIYLYHVFITKKLCCKNLLVYITTVALFGFVFIQISKSFDPNFISNYSSYGQNEFEVLNPLSSKIGQLKYFYLKLFYQVSGTYYTPNIKFQFFLFPLSLIYTLVKLFSTKIPLYKEPMISIVLSIFAVNIGIILIGRYNQTSIVFLFPLFYILVAFFLDHLNEGRKKYIGILLFAILSLYTLGNIGPYQHNDYKDYLLQISKSVPKDAVVLGNLNTEYYFDHGKLHDYRNLAFLRKNNMTFQQYMATHHIQYIIYPEEMDLIYAHRPRWNGIYGNLLYYEEMKDFFNDRCQEVHQFTDSTYAMRITQYMDTQDWKIKIYKVLDPPMEPQK